MEIEQAVKELDALFEKYKIKDARNFLNFRNDFISYVKSLENKDLQDEFDKQEFFYDFVELQKKVGWDKDLLNEYTMVVSSASKNLKQLFTPQQVNKILGKIAIKEESNTFYDATGGTGSTVISAWWEWSKKQKCFNDTYNHLAYIDELDIYNCYCCVFNFLIRGMNAIVSNIDTLEQTRYVTFIVANGYPEKECWFSKYKALTNEELKEQNLILARG